MLKNSRFKKFKLNVLVEVVNIIFILFYGYLIIYFVKKEIGIKLSKEKNFFFFYLL